MGWWQTLWRRGRSAALDVPIVDYATLKAAAARYTSDDGEKFPGGFGPTNLLVTDYWTLRARSSQLFETNLYARGTVRRLITAEINTGLHLEASPEEMILGVKEDSLSGWSETVENRFALWGKDARLCDHAELRTFGALQEIVRLEALVAGDVLVVLLQDPRTFLPRLQLINGAAVQTPMNAPALAAGNKIVHGVEIAPDGRHVAYHVARDRQVVGGMATNTVRLPAYGEKTGQRQAWLVYGTEKRLDDVRGKPLLALMLQSLREIDRYRDSVQRKAVINSMLAMYIKKTEAKSGTRPMASGGISRKTDVTVDNEGETRRFRTADHIPGLVLDELQHGEEPHGFASNGTDEKFGDFERAILQSIAWSLEIPPEILLLSFNSNYSASQAAINEFKLYLNKVRTTFGDTLCQPVYNEWLIAAVRAKKVSAPGLLEALRDWGAYETFAAWTSADWTGHIKPAVDLSKLVRGYKEMVNEGFMTRDRATRELNGSKYSKNVQKLRLENEALAEANKPMVELAAAMRAKPTGPDAMSKRIRSAAATPINPHREAS